MTALQSILTKYRNDSANAKYPLELFIRVINALLKLEI